MSRTISFRASEELDEFLEEEAERRMTTKSTVAQMLIAERVKNIKANRDGQATLEQSVPSEVEEASEQEVGEPDLPEVFEKHSDKWYEPDSKNNNFAVRLKNGQRKYYKTVEYAAERLRDEYE